MAYRTRLRPRIVDISGGYWHAATSTIETKPEKEYPPAKFVRSYGGQFDCTHSCVDEVTPGYFKLAKERKHLPVNFMSTNKPELEDDAQVDITLKAGYEVPGGTPSRPSWTVRRGVWELRKGIPVPFPQRYNPEFPVDAMLQSALAKMRGELWDIGTFVAEFRKTTELVTKAREGSLKRAQRILLYLEQKWVRTPANRRSAVTAKQLADDFASLWMEGRFGWRILYYDLISAQQAYESLVGGMSLLSKRWTETRDMQHEPAPLWSPLRIGTSTTPFKYRWNTTSTSTMRAGVMGHIDLTTPVSVDPIVTLWEVIPFSMVSDWFVNIGDALQAWSPFATGKLDHAFTSKTNVSTHQLEVAVNLDYSFQGRPLADCKVEGGRQSGEVVLFQKDYIRQRANPSFDFSFDPNLGNLRWLDGIALMWILRRRLSGLLKIVHKL